MRCVPGGRGGEGVKIRQPSTISDKRCKHAPGEVHGQLTLVRRHLGGKWLAKCSCGHAVFVDTRSLNNGKKKSCGCLPSGQKTRPLRERFTEKYRIDKSGCWLWTGCVDVGGYGKIGSGCKYGRAIAAHRVAYELFVGPIPRGLFACHRCDVRACVNPAHLFIGTAADNAKDMVAKGRQHHPDYRGKKNPRYGQAVSAKTKYKISRSLARPFRLTKSDGTVVEGVNLARFCRENGINEGCFSMLRHGRLKQTHGFIAVG